MRLASHGLVTTASVSDSDYVSVFESFSFSVSLYLSLIQSMYFCLYISLCLCFSVSVCLSVSLSSISVPSSNSSFLFSFPFLSVSFLIFSSIVLSSISPHPSSLRASIRHRSVTGWWRQSSEAGGVGLWPHLDGILMPSRKRWRQERLETKRMRKKMWSQRKRVAVWGGVETDMEDMKNMN